MKALLLAGLVALSTPTLASEDICPTLGAAAKGIMEFRQAGVPLSSIMVAFTDDGSSVQKVMKAIVLDAYAHPIMSLERNKISYIHEFENKILLECYES